MDTRHKILTLEAARQLPLGTLTLVTGTFNPLRAAHARELAAVRNRTPGHPLLVVVLPAEPALLPSGARAELVAAMRVVDYVVTADHGETEQLIGRLAPFELSRLEAADAVRTDRLIAHVTSRQTR